MPISLTAFLDASLLTFLGVASIPILLFWKRERLARVDRGFTLVAVGIALVAVAAFVDYSLVVIANLDIRAITETSFWKSSGTILAGLLYFPGLVIAGFGLSSWLPAIQRLDREIDRREKLESELRALTKNSEQLARDAEKANQAKSEFLSNMSHELRTPLNAVIGFSEALGEGIYGPLNDQQKHTIADIREAGLHLLDLINDILDLAKIEAGKFEPRFEEVNVERTIERALRLLNDRAKRESIQILTELPANLPALIADERLLKQMLINLLSNAIKFTPAGGSAVVAISIPNDGGMHVEVRDKGIGIDAANIPRALAAFGQIDSSMERRYQGTGLGLPLVKLFMEQHGGKLEIESEIGVGTTARLLFPANNAERSSQQIPE